MTDHKFTDNEIIKALNCCAEAEYCATCLATDSCKGMDSLMENALALINRQNAELEDLREIVFMDRSEAIKNLKAEAIKEFAQRLKKKMYPYNGVDKKKYAINAYAVEQAIECIAKEMTEGK